VRSMTGFGYADSQSERMSVAVEVKSYNHRYLDVFVNLPPYLGPLEPMVRKLTGERAARGRVEVGVRLTELADEVRILVDRRTAAAYKEALEALAADLGVTERVGLSHLLRLEGVVKTDRVRDMDLYWRAVEEPLRRALDAWDSTRTTEGAALETDIASAVSAIEAEVTLISSRRGQIEASIKEDLRRRFAEVLAGQVDEARVLSETAVMLVRFDINEEIVRLGSHIASFRDEMAAGSGVGKKLDFVAQELNREVNTIGSKSIDLEVSSAVIRAKDAIERIREQLRNIE
jgi:uncharacterized protein (TIGR00255 family)